MAVDPQYAATPIVDQFQLTTINTNVDGTGTVVSCAVGTASGKRIQRVRLTAAQLSIANGVVRFYYSPDNGTTKRMITEVLVTAVTGSATARVWSDVAPELAGFELVTTNAILYASTTVSQTINGHVESGLL